jgi:hypothetical protein
VFIDSNVFMINVQQSAGLCPRVFVLSRSISMISMAPARSIGSEEIRPTGENTWPLMGGQQPKPAPEVDENEGRRHSGRRQADRARHQ